MVEIRAIGNSDLRSQRGAPQFGQMVLEEVTSGSTAARTRYSNVAIVLHWSIAVLVFATIPIGWFGATFETELAQSATNAHKTTGIVILALTLARLAWRLTHKAPTLPQNMAPALRWIAKATHVLFYILLVVLPMSGWWMSSAVPKRHAFGFGFFDIPFLPVPRGFASAGPAHAMHVNLAWLMVGLVALHVLAALKHQFFDKDDILARMLPPRA